MQLHINNTTHWRTADLRRVIKSALEAAGFSEEAEVAVQSRSVVPTVYCNILPTGALAVILPRRGPRDLHSHPATALALAAVELPKDVRVLAFSETFRLANAVYHWAGLPKEERRGRIKTFIERDTPPTWAPPETFVVQKYKDPLRDERYVDFISEKKRLLCITEAEIYDLQQRIDKATAQLKTLQRNKSSIQRSIDTARRRRLSR